MSRSRARLALLATTLLVVAGLAASAAAAPSATAKPLISPAPVAATPYSGGSLEVQIWPQADSNIPTQAVVISDVQLPSTTKLPATVRIPVVPGSQVMWAGEALGGSPDADPQRPFKLVDAAGGKYAEFVISKSLRGQIDSVGIPLSFSGDEVKVSVNWIQSTEASSVVFTVRFPAGSSRIQTDPKATGTPQTNMAGESLYGLPQMTLAPGARKTITASYSTNPSGDTAMSQNTKWAIYAVLGGLLLLAIVVLVILAVRRRGSGSGDGPGDDTPDDGGVWDDNDLGSED